jgi:PAS domain S-box-containing protein
MSSRTSRFHGEARDSAIPMLVVCADGTVAYANPAVHRLLGYQQGALPGLYMEQLAPETERAALILVRAAGENATNIRIRSRAMRADGRVLDVSMTIEPCVHDPDHAVDVFVSYKPLAPWEAQRVDDDDARDSVTPARLAG